MKKIFIYIKAFFITLRKRVKKKSKSLPYSSFVSSAPNVNVIAVNPQEKETNVLDVDLISHNLDIKEKKQVRQYTKIAVTLILVMAIIWITWSYILATVALIKFETFQPLMSLSQQVCITILGTMLGYYLKSYFESYQEKKNEMLMNNNYSDNSMVTNYDDTPVTVNNNISSNVSNINEDTGGIVG